MAKYSPNKLQMKIVSLLKEINLSFDDSYVVGGILRDIFLTYNFLEKLLSTGHTKVDIDIIVFNLVENKLKKILLQYNLPFVLLDQERKIYRTVVVEKTANVNIEFTVDISNYEDLSTDISRRDFTINMLAVKLEYFIKYLTTKEKKFITANIIDKYGGVKDIKNKLLKIVNPKVFTDDPLRILRVARFMCYGFTPEAKIEKLVSKSKHLLKYVAKERIIEELKKIFNLNSYNVLEWLDKNKVLEEIIPEIKIAKIKGKNSKFRNFYFHPEGLWQHIKLTYKKTEYVLSSLKRLFPQHYQVFKQNIENKIYLSKLAALFHDIAKPLVVKKYQGRIRFFYHETKSALIAAEILQRLRFSNDDIHTIKLLIENHMRIGNLCHSKTLTERAFLRLFRELDDNLWLLIVLSLADRYSYDSIPERVKDLKLKEMPKFRKFVRLLLNKFIEYKHKKSLPRLVNGHIIMEKFNLSAGPLIGEILRFVEEQQLLGKISTTQQALHLVERYLKTHNRSNGK